MSKIGIVFAVILAALILYSFFKSTPTPAATIATTPGNYFNPNES